MAILTVGVGMQYGRISDAVKAAKDGDVVQVNAGTYTNDFPEVNAKISIVGVGGMAKLVATIDPPNGKGILLANNDLKVDHLEFSGAHTSGLNGCGIRYQGGNLTVTNSYFHDNQMNLLTNPIAGAVLVVDNCEFGKTIPTSGYSHSLYIGQIAKATITDSYFHDTATGHHIKSRAMNTIVENNRMVDGSGGSDYSVDLPYGGNGVIRNNVVEQADNGGNPNILHFGGEGLPYSSNSLLVDSNTIINDRASGGVGVLNQTSVVAEVANNKFYHVPTLMDGPGHLTGNTTLSTKPVVDTSHPYDTSTSTSPTPTPTPTDPSTTKVITGTDGSDVLDGRGSEATMSGGAGNDTYIVDSSGDVVKELSGQGTDLVKSSISYSLNANVENLQLTGLAKINGIGNGLDNQITGNDADNRLVGSYGKDTLLGNGGNDLLEGGAGRDVLTGGSGADKFGFHLPSEGTSQSWNGLKGSSGDRITDFQSGVDKIVLEASGFNLTAGGPTLGKDLVVLNTQFNGTNAGGSDFGAHKPALIIDSTGTLYYDKNGADAGYTVLATVQSGAKIAHTDIQVLYEFG